MQLAISPIDCPQLVFDIEQETMSLQGNTFGVSEERSPVNPINGRLEVIRSRHGIYCGEDVRDVDHGITGDSFWYVLNGTIRLTSIAVWYGPFQGPAMALTGRRDSGPLLEVKLKTVFSPRSLGLWSRGGQVSHQPDSPSRSSSQQSRALFSLPAKLVCGNFGKCSAML